MSTLVAFGRKMMFIGHKLGQLVIIDLLCFWCYFLRSDLASLLYIWSLFRIVSEQAVSPAWIVSLEGRDRIVMLCAERAARIIKDGDELKWVTWLLSLDTRGWRACAVFLRVLFLDNFSDAPLHLGIKSYFILLKKTHACSITCLLPFYKHFSFISSWNHTCTICSYAQYLAEFLAYAGVW